MATLTGTQRVELEKFAALLGVDAVPAADGSFNFEFERLGALSIMATDDDRIVVALSRSPRRRDGDADLRLLSVAGVDPLDGAALHAGLTADGDHMLAVGLSAAGLSAADLDAALSRLVQRFEMSA